MHAPADGRRPVGRTNQDAQRALRIGTEYLASRDADFEQATGGLFPARPGRRPDVIIRPRCGAFSLRISNMTGRFGNSHPPSSALAPSPASDRSPPTLYIWRFRGVSRTYDPCARAPRHRTGPSDEEEGRNMPTCRERSNLRGRRMLPACSCRFVPSVCPNDRRSDKRRLTPDR